MPIGVPRIIYCWGEELPAQWTDIYNFIFRRRMVFLMQYLDDELCNQICGLLINIHMEDRSNELEKKERGESSTSSGPSRSFKADKSGEQKPTSASTRSMSKKKNKSIEDLLNASEDLGVNEVHTLEQFTLQKITTEWLNWNAQFFDYSDEPYLYYLAELLNKDPNSMGGSNSSSPYGNNINVTQLLNMLQSVSKNGNKNVNNQLSLYSAFRNKENISPPYSQKVNFKDLNPFKQKLFQMFKKNNSILLGNQSSSYLNETTNDGGGSDKNKDIKKLLSALAIKDFKTNVSQSGLYEQLSEKALGQRTLRREYNFAKEMVREAHPRSPQSAGQGGRRDNLKAWNVPLGERNSEFRDYYRKQTERTLIDEESKKVFVIINSFGGSVGNGITVHDALQFIKAGSLTLALGVAASASSLALAGGTIGERYVTEGCHVMVHQPESSLQGQASDIWIDSQEILKIRLDVAEIYSLSTYRPQHKILRDLDRDFYLTATETIAYGLADEIASNDVMSAIIEETNRVWDYHDTKQQSLLETRVGNLDASRTQTEAGR